MASSRLRLMVGRATRRLRWHRGVALWCHPGVVSGLTGALLGVTLAFRLGDVGEGLRRAALLLPLVVVFSAALRGRARATDGVQAARALDTRLGLDGRVLAAHELALTAPMEPWTLLAVQDAVREEPSAAALAEAVPLGWRWRGALPVVLWALLLAVPARPATPPVLRATGKPALAPVKLVDDATLQRHQRALAAGLASSDGSTKALARDALALVGELSAGRVSRGEALARLTELAGRAERAQRERQLDRKALSELAQRLNHQNTAKSPSAEDLQRAAQRLERLAQQERQGSPQKAERDEVSRAMAQAAQANASAPATAQMQQSSGEGAAEGAQSPEQLEAMAQQLRAQGAPSEPTGELSELADRLAMLQQQLVPSGGQPQPPQDASQPRQPGQGLQAASE